MDEDDSIDEIDVASKVFDALKKHDEGELFLMEQFDNEVHLTHVGSGGRFVLTARLV